MLVNANAKALTCTTAISAVEEGVLYYDRRQAAAVPESLRRYVSGDHHLYLKQVPSALTLRKAGGLMDAGDLSVLLEDGFTIFKEAARSNLERTMNNSPETSFEEEIDHMSDNTDMGEDVPHPDLPGRDFIYEDPFKVLAGWALAQTQSQGEGPKIYIWPGGCHRIQGKLSPRLCGVEEGNSLYFSTMKSHESKLYLLQNHTHWGHLLWRARYMKDDPPIGRHFAKTLWKRISHFLRGKSDPLWTKEERELYLICPDKDRSRHSRAGRFLEVLKTVDGMFLQRYFAFPEEVWNWDKYDMFIVQGISYLIGDEFLDGDITEYAMSQKTAYSDLKSARKAFKLVIHQDDPIEHLKGLKVPRWVESYLSGTWNQAVRLTGYQRIFVAGIMSQTRGSGTPPPSVVLQSKEKFLKSVQEEPPVLTETEIALVNASLDSAISGIPGDIFTGLDTKARVTVTGSACWEDTRKDGGTAQAVLEIMSKYNDDNFIPVRNLDNGSVDSWKRKDEFESIGTAVFYGCLQEVLDTNPADLGEVFLTLVREPGKARSVTKGHAALKIVLDTVSKICSYPLKKGFKTSESGMGKSHHGWNLFKDMFSEEMDSDLFQEDRSKRVDTPFADYVERHVEWQEVFAGSTDYQEATDRMVHQFAELASVKWMNKCGIPPLLQGITRAVCYRPRKIYFTGTGVLEKYGTLVDASTDTRVIILKRGVLMGDPLTKVVLHFSNIVARELGSTLTDGSIFTVFSNGEECRSAYRDIISQ
jgi:hypothetical protein